MNSISNMISFFRKIRQKLLSEKRVIPYSLYTIGEITLLIFGSMRINERTKTQFFPSWEGSKGWV
ncbi:MAG: hypothetical protein AAGF96_05325 [Bacteroidota bacterium]